VRQLAWQTTFRNAAAWAEPAITIWPSIEYRFAAPWILVRANGAVPVFFPTQSNGGPVTVVRGNVELMLTLDASVALRVWNFVDVGVGFLAWMMPTAATESLVLPEVPGIFKRGPDLGQTALTFAVRTDDELDSPIGGGVELLVNLDDTWGPTGTTGRYWGLSAFVRGAFDVDLTSR
jgi:hypothetical protein